MIIKRHPWLIGILSVMVIGAAMAVAWWKYSNFLTQGMRPSEGTMKLNAMEKSGVPDFELADLDGKTVRLSEFKDSVVILSFWASWCDPCIAEFPSMIKLVEHFKGKVVMVAVSADSAIEDINSFLKTFGGVKKGVVVLWDRERAVAQKYGTEVLPESYVLGKGLKLIRKVAGSENWYSPDAIQFFQEIVNGKNQK